MKRCGLFVAAFALLVCGIDAQTLYDCEKYATKAIWYSPPLPCLNQTGASCVNGVFDRCGCVCICQNGFGGPLCNLTAETSGSPFGFMWSVRRRGEFSRGFFLNGTLEQAAGAPVNDFTIEFYASMQYPIANFVDLSPTFFEFREPLSGILGATNSIPTWGGGLRFPFSMISYFRDFRRAVSFEYYSTMDGTKGQVLTRRSLVGQTNLRIDPNIASHTAITVRVVNTTEGRQGQVVELYSDGVLDETVFHSTFQRYDNRSLWFGSLQNNPNYVDPDFRLWPWDLEGFQLDEIRVWKRALTQSEIVSLNAKKLRGDEPDLLAYLPFDYPERFILRNTAVGGNGWLDGIVLNETIRDPTNRFDNQNVDQIWPEYTPSLVRSHTGMFAAKPGSISIYGHKPDPNLSIMFGSTFLKISGDRLILIGGAQGDTAMQLLSRLDNSTNGSSLSSQASKSTWIFNTTSTRFSVLNTDNSAVSSGFFFHSSTAFNDGRSVLIIGGSLSVGQSYLFDSTTLAWSVPTGLASFSAALGPVIGHSATQLGRSLYVYGGGVINDGRLEASSKLFLLNLDTFAFELIRPNVGELWPEPRMFHGSLPRPQLNKFYLFGGIGSWSNSANISTVWEFNTQTRKFTLTNFTGPALPNRFGASYVQHGNNSVLVFGGVPGFTQISRWHLPGTGYNRDLFFVVDSIRSTTNSSDTSETINVRQVTLEKLDGGVPLHRFAHAACWDAATAGFWVHGGLFAAKRTDPFSPTLTGIGGDTFAATPSYFVRTGCPRGYSKYLVDSSNFPTIDTALSASCSPCPPGTTAPFGVAERPVLERLVCLACPAGTYAPEPGSPSCLACPLGTYSDNSNSTSCKPCPPDSTTLASGSTSPSECVLTSLATQGLVVNQVAVGIGVAAAVAVAVGGSIVGIILFRRWRKKTDVLLSQQKTALLLDIDEAQFQFKFLKASELELGEELGHGSFGTVYKGTYHGQTVAIKVSTPGNQQGVEDFLKEADVMMQLDTHPNVLSLIGICISGGSAMVVLEFANAGSLDKLVQKGSPFKDELEVRAFITEIVQGLRHLHSHNLIHRDLACRNILLVKDSATGKLTPKIADFGMSRVLSADEAQGKTVTTFGPVPWMAPEAIGELRYSTASDVWSLGVAIWELITGLDPAQQMELTDLAIAIRDKGHHPRIQNFFPSWVQKILNGCWAMEPLDRLTLDEILRILDPNVVVTTAIKKQPKQAKGASEQPAPSGAAKDHADDPALLLEVKKLKEAIESAEKRNNELRKEIEALNPQPPAITKKQSKRAWARSVAPSTLKNVYDEDADGPKLTKKKSSRRKMPPSIEQPQ